MFRTLVFLKLFNVTFFSNLIDARFVYTARGGFGIAVRKFFEIPAAGAVMICAPPLGFRQLGFQDGLHYVHSEPEHLPGILRALEADPDRSQSIARNGQRLVLARHSLHARSEQFAACLSALVQGAYLGSSWVNGEYEVRVAS